MNLREGTRRLALLLGGLGAIAGGVLSYVYLQPVIRQREMHKAFEQLANSDVVKEQRKTLQSPDPYASIAKPLPQSGNSDPFASIAKPIPQHGRAKLSDIAPPAKVYLDDNGNPIAATSSTAKPIPQIDPKTGERISPNIDYDALAKKYGGTSDPLPSAVSKGGIETINWSHDYGVASIETDDGQTLYPTAAPSAWLYLLIALLPLFGFLIPWGVIRAIGWVMTGFVQPTKWVADCDSADITNQVRPNVSQSTLTRAR